MRPAIATLIALICLANARATEDYPENRAAEEPEGTTVEVDHISNDTYMNNFRFDRMPVPFVNHFGKEAILSVVEGTPSPMSMPVAKLNQGVSPNDEFQNQHHFAFNYGTREGRIEVDLTEVASITHIYTYSYGGGVEGPQLYAVYGSDGTADNFSDAPKRGVDPTKVGWKLIAKVDTRPKDASTSGGHYAVKIGSTNDEIGKYRYLFFVISPLVKGQFHTSYNQLFIQ